MGNQMAKAAKALGEERLNQTDEVGEEAGLNFKHGQDLARKQD